MLERLDTNGKKLEEVGRDVYNDDRRQTLSLVMVPGQGQNFLARIKNTGQNATSFQVSVGNPFSSTAAQTPWKPTGWEGYATLDGGTTNILAELQSKDGWTTPLLKQGDECVLRFSVTAPITLAEPVLIGSFRLMARIGANGDAVVEDAVVAQLALQFLSKIQWISQRDPDKEENWHDLVGTVRVPRLRAVGLRAIAIDPELGWEQLPGFLPTWDVKEPWEAKPVHHLGEMIWIQCKEEGTVSFTATGGRQISGQIVVIPATP